MRWIAVWTLLVGCVATDPATDTDTDTDTDTEGEQGEDYGTELQRGIAGTAVSASRYVCGSGTSTCDTSACGTNTAPVLGTPVLVVNGFVATTASMGDHVQVLVPYEDADCNMGCGGVQVSYGTPSLSADREASSCDDQPCNTRDSGVYVGVGFGTVDEAGEYYASFRITDACGDRSAPVDFSFTL